MDSHGILYQLDHRDINALIDINKRGGSADGLPDDISLDKEAHPLCRAGHHMCCWGYDKNKDAQKYRCPLACDRVAECPFSSECGRGSYGRTVYIKNSSDLRFHPRIPRDSDQYKTIYSERSASERVNNRVLNDYHLQDLKICGDDHFSFWTMIIGICIHLDAWYKMSSRAGHTPFFKGCQSPVQSQSSIYACTITMNKQYVKESEDDLGFILIDDPVQTMDDINISSMIEVLRNDFKDRQIILSTHETDKENYILYKFFKYNRIGQSFNVKDQLYGV